MRRQEMFENVLESYDPPRIVTVLQRLRIRPVPSRGGQRNRNPVLIEVRRWVGSMRGPMHFTDRWVCNPTVLLTRPDSRPGRLSHSHHGRDPGAAGFRGAGALAMLVLRVALGD